LQIGKAINSGFGFEEVEHSSIHPERSEGSLYPLGS